MADEGLTLNSGTGGSDLAVDNDASSRKHQYVKVEFGASGTQTPVSAANPLPVVQTGTHTVTANAGTNLNTSALALESGGNLAGAATSLAVIDDWDESDRAKVNIVVGQAGITAGAGAVAANTPRVTHASDDPVTTAVQLLDDVVVTDDAAFTPATTKVAMVGFQADETATDSIDEGDAGAARMTLDRKQIVTPYAHAAAGGATPYKNLDCDESEDEIKGSAGKLFWVHAINLANAKRYLKFYNDTAANVSVGTTVPVLTFPIPTMGDTNGAGFTINFGDMGVQFSAAITVAATTGFADADTGAPGANEVILNAGYL